MAHRKSWRATRGRLGFHASTESLEPRVLLTGTTFDVFTAADSGEGSLRTAIEEANAAPGSTIVFDIRQGPLTINVLKPLPVILAPVLIDGTSQPGYAGTPLVTVSGQIEAAPGFGFVFVNGSGGSVIQGLAVMGFGLAGIEVDGASNVTIGGSGGGLGNVISGNTGEGVLISGVGASANSVEGNVMGLDASAKRALGNGIGVQINLGATGNLIGGTTAAERNVISGNLTEGVLISGTGTMGNTVEGNDIGTDGTAMKAFGNQTGVEIDSAATANIVGGATAGASNVVSGNTGDGVRISGAGTSGNTVEGDLIGTDVSGQSPLPNDRGVEIDSGATANVIGGIAAGVRNIISSNTAEGVRLTGAGTAGNVVEGDYIGTDASGQSAVGNSIGVLVTGGSATTIGGTAAGAGNVISGNITAGIDVDGTGAVGNQIVGNLIGTNATGTAAVVRAGQTDPLDALQNAGVAIIGSQGNVIGGTSLAARNVISGNYVGVNLADLSAQGDPNSVLGNRIGTDASGEKPLGNIVGVYINGAAGNVVGGNGAGSTNVISGNTSVGVEILGAGSTANLIEGNLIGPAADGQGAFPRGRGLFIQTEGIFVRDASGNMIGGTGSQTANVISGNNSAGVFILSLSGVSQGNTIEGNLIGSS
ncbi:MAG TPA: hypothetical protein VKA15_01925, partial [Isosphaeraceae bacterium]|nr:hypothetical protein [Isosphaeraceae bacterium]